MYNYNIEHFVQILDNNFLNAICQASKNPKERKIHNQGI